MAKPTDTTSAPLSAELNPTKNEQGKELEAIAAQRRALAEQASVDAELFEDAGGGFELADADCYAIPFLKLLQAMSPECNEAEGTAVPGARSGMFYLTSTGELFDGDKGVYILQVEFERRFLHWRPKSDSGGGFLGAVSVADIMGMQTREAQGDEKPRGARFSDDGTYYNDTREHYVLVAAPPAAPGEQPSSWSMAMISLSSTQIKKSKKLMQALSALRIEGAGGKFFNPPTWSRWIHVQREPEKNNDGSWWGWKFTVKFPEAIPLRSRAALNDAKGFREAILSGKAKPSDPNDDDGFGPADSVAHVSSQQPNPPGWDEDPGF